MAICNLKKSVLKLREGFTQLQIFVFDILYFLINFRIFKIIKVQAQPIHFNECTSARILEKLCILKGSVRIIYKKKYIKFRKCHDLTYRRRS